MNSTETIIEKETDNIDIGGGSSGTPARPKNDGIVAASESDSEDRRPGI